MFSKYSTRREFFKIGSLFFLFLLNSCSNVSKKVKIALQSSFYPDFFKDTIPKTWQKENINITSLNPEKNEKIILESDFTLINDGWISSIKFEEFKKINEKFLFQKLDKRSRVFLNSFDENQRNKLFPIGVVPYAIIIKNNQDLINSARQSWDFLLSKKLTKKIIFPQSPRIIMSIAKKINQSNSLAKLKNQAMLFDDQNSLNWLINSEACIAIIPYSLCLKYFKIDSRLSIVFPKQGVPLMWHFVLNKVNGNSENLISWIESLESKSNAYKLASQGWYLPFKNKYFQNNNNPKNSKISGPSEKCWDNSWSLPPLTNEEKINLENNWNK